MVLLDTKQNSGSQRGLRHLSVAPDGLTVAFNCMIKNAEPHTEPEVLSTVQFSL